jgi:hypothetical protein
MFIAEFELTNRCNTRCLHCPHEVMSRPSGRLTWDTFKTITDKIRAHVKGERFALQLSGMGEPLLHPEIDRFIKHVSADAITSFSTNGLALTQRNVERLINAGLDRIYFSFNGDEPELFSRMMGGISFERVLANLRGAIKATETSRLEVWANLTVAKTNRDHLTSITRLLEDEGIAGVCYSMAHTRGGSLRDPSVFDTPPIPADVTHCEVLRSTLFIDWRGQTFICDHDIHGEHSLGNLVSESLEAILERRQRLIDEGVTFRICGECNDVLKMGVKIFPDGYSGTLRDWVYDVYRDDDRAALADESPQIRWLYDLYVRESRTDRMVKRLMDRSKRMQDEIAQRDATIAQLSKRVFKLETDAVGRRILNWLAVLGLRFYVPSIFDEDWYVSVNPDVAHAIERGGFKSGREHYRKFGYFEMRPPNPSIDEDSERGISDAARQQIGKELASM